MLKTKVPHSGWRHGCRLRCQGIGQSGLKPGELAIISADTALPYERPPLSKGFLSGKDDETSILINSPDWYREHGIEVRVDTVIEHIDPNKK